MKRRKGIDRRGFLKASALGLAGAGTFFVPRSSSAGQDTGTEFPKIKGYRVLGRTGFKVSDIGIGTSAVYPAAIMGTVLDAGVNYIDTAEGYGRTAAEKSAGEAIKGRERKSLFITTKVPMRDVASKEQVREKVAQCLERLQTDYIDCLMIQGTPTVESLNNEYFHQAVADLKKEDKVRFIGAASHGSRAPGQGEPMETVLLGAIEDGRFDLLLLVYNFIQREAGEQILEAAAKKNIAATIMKSNPLGRYFEMQEKIEQMKKAGEPIDEKMQGFIAQMEETAKKAEPFLQKNNLKDPGEIKAAALKFVLSNPQVHTLNLAFRNFDDIRNSLILSGSALRKKDESILAAYKDGYGALYCRHACGLCEPSCPYNVPVNAIMRYNHYFEAQGGEKFAMEKYARLGTPKADQCRNCAGFCQSACPYGVPIQGLLNIAHSQLTLA